MSALLQRVRKTIQRHALCPPGTRLLVGLSGGSDSVALVLLLRELGEHGGFTVAGLAHLNHRLRASADNDEAFCRAFADRLGCRIVVEGADVKEYASDRGLSTEDAARRIRYDFLERAAGSVGADRIAVGHTQDDQAETFLLKLMRGAGLTGLAGIYPRRGRVVRPLLDVSRGELRDHLREQGEQWVEDETNAGLENPRNRVRHVILPELDSAAGGATRPAIARAAALAREDGEWLDAVACERYLALVETTAEGLAMDVAAAAGEPRAIRRRLLLRALRVGAGGREVSQEHVELAMAVLEGSCGGADVPGGRVERSRGKLVVVQRKVVPK